MYSYSFNILAGTARLALDSLAHTSQSLLEKQLIISTMTMISIPFACPQRRYFIFLEPNYALLVFYLNILSIIAIHGVQRDFKGKLLEPCGLVGGQFINFNSIQFFCLFQPIVSYIKSIQ